jgi:NAD(P)-dependent dehydrogenase (short-subunit alcohol dehydrogenase family)
VRRTSIGYRRDIATRPVAVVTGASGGVGRATARAFAARGFDVALLARGAAGLDAAAAEVRGAGARALPCTVDVAEYDEVERAADAVESELGAIDVWVNDAMTTVFAPFTEVEPGDFERAVRVTFLGQVWGTRVALARMLPRDRGTIVNVGSALAYAGIPLQSPYCAAKFACRGFTTSLRAELLHTGSNVRVGMVHLPAVNTPQFSWCKNLLARRPMPVPPIYQPELAADAIVAAALEGRRSRVLGSWNKLVVAAGSVWPAFVTQFAARTAWDGQLTDEPSSPDDPVNLREPADERVDFGARGHFGDRAGGFTDPSFLRSLPRTVANLFAAAGATIEETRSAHAR